MGLSTYEFHYIAVFVFSYPNKVSSYSIHNLSIANIFKFSYALLLIIYQFCLYNILLNRKETLLTASRFHPFA